MRACWLVVAACGTAAPPRPANAPPAPVIAEPVAPEPVPEPEPEPVPPPDEPVALPPCPVDARRDLRRRPDDIVSLVAPSKAMTLVDVGAGDGYFLCRLARAAGRVIATEISKPDLTKLAARVEREQLANVEVVRAPSDDVGVGPGSADRILVVNVWHHLADRKRYAARVARVLAPGGALFVVDFLPGGGHGITPDRVIAELAAGGIDAHLIPEDLPGQYVIVGTVRTAVPTCDPRLGLPPRVHCIDR